MRFWRILSENVEQLEAQTGFGENIHHSVEGHTFADLLPAEQLENPVVPQCPVSLLESHLPSQHLHLTCLNL
jgi:hypothetical protein